jgi:hypothetical protein
MVKKYFLIFLIFSFSSNAMLQGAVDCQGELNDRDRAEDSKVEANQTKEDSKVDANPTFNQDQIVAIKSAFPNHPFSTDKSSYEACLDLLMEGVMQKLQYSCLSKYLISPLASTMTTSLLSVLGVGAFIIGFINKDEIYKIVGGVVLSVGVFIVIVGCILYGKYVYDATPDLHNNMIGRALASIVAEDIQATTFIVKAGGKQVTTSGVKAEDYIHDKIKERVDEVFDEFTCCGCIAYPYYPNPARLLEKVAALPPKKYQAKDVVLDI